MRFRLRTLLIIAGLLPPLLAGGWFVCLAAVQTISYSDWEYQLKPLLVEVGSVALLIALVTVASEGPYEALPIATQLDAKLIAPSVSSQSLAFALRAGFQVDLEDYSQRAAELLRPYRRDAIQEVFQTQVLPALGLR